jgi:hypothetical protein
LERELKSKQNELLKREGRIQLLEEELNHKLTQAQREAQLYADEIAKFKKQQQEIKQTAERDNKAMRFVRFILVRGLKKSLI